MDVEYLELHGSYFVTVTRQPPRYKFELDGQGRAVCFEPLPDVVPGAALQIQIVKRV